MRRVTGAQLGPFCDTLCALLMYAIAMSQYEQPLAPITPESERALRRPDTKMKGVYRNRVNSFMFHCRKMNSV